MDLPRRAVFEELEVGTRYTFSVLATNRKGDGPPAHTQDALTAATTPLPPLSVVATAGDDLVRQQRVVPFLEGKVPRNGEATAYVCERFVCQLPTTDVGVFAEQLGRKD